MLGILKNLKGIRTLGICALALLFVLADAAFSLDILNSDVRVTIVLAALTFGGMRFASTGPVRLRVLAFLVLPFFLLVTSCSSMERMHKESTDAGTPVTAIVHIEEEHRGLRFRGGLTEAASIETVLGSQNRLANIMYTHLGDDALHWEHINQLGAGATGTSAKITGRTVIRIDRPQYLGPLIDTQLDYR